MDRVLAIFIFVIFILLVEPLLLAILTILGTTAPEFGLLGILYIAHGIKGSPSKGAAASMGIGYAMDLYSGAPIGMYSFVYVVTYFSARIVSWRIYGRSYISQAILGGIFSLFSGFLIVSIDKWLSPVKHTWILLNIIPKQALVTAIFAAPFFYVLWRIDRMVSYEAPPDGVFK
jgi:rod shape-determining protein MreD